MSNGKYLKLGSVRDVKDKARSKATCSTLEDIILDFIADMPDNADVHVEVSEDLWK